MALKLNRRKFPFTSAASIAGIALAACAKPQVATPAAPATAAPTQRPLNTPVPTKPPATLVPTALPAHEAPMLAELVKAGTLPALVDRLPKNPLTLKPVNKVGKYSNSLDNPPMKEDGAMGNLGWVIPTPATHNPETFSFK